MDNCATNHAIFFIMIINISVLLVHEYGFISSSVSKSTDEDSTSSGNFPTNIAVPLFLAFLSGALFTLLGILIVIEFPNLFTSSVRSCLRRIKLLRQSPPPPSPTVDQRSSTVSIGGISASQLQALPIFVYYAENRFKLGKSAGDCAICLTEFLNEQTLRWLPGCDHLFHRGCIDTWFESRKTCPCCRANVERVGGEILLLENGSNSVGSLRRDVDGDGGREIGDGRRVRCERRVLSCLFRVLMGRRRHYSHRHR